MLSSLQLTEMPDHWVLPLAGHEVDQCQLDYAITLVLADRPTEHTELRIEAPFELLSPDGQTIQLDPERTMELTPALALLHQTVDHVFAYKDGRLELVSTAGLMIRVPVGKGFEAWQLAGPNRLRFVCHYQVENWLSGCRRTRLHLNFKIHAKGSRRSL